MRTERFLVSLLLISAALHARERWKLEYFYDKPDAAFGIRDFRCSGGNTCLAAGVIDANQQKGAVLRTSDSGAHWTLAEVHGEPSALFLLNENVAWLSTLDGLWSSTDGGATWKKRSKVNGILALYFSDDSHGIAAGSAGALFQTTDGGTNWTPAMPKAEKSSVVYDSIFFEDARHGFIIGRSGASLRALAWLNPQRTTRVTEKNQTMVLETKDGGVTWSPFTGEFLDGLMRLVPAKDSLPLALYNEQTGSEYPGSVNKLDLRSKTGVTVFRRPDQFVSDAAVFPPEIFLASINTPGKLKELPIPGRLFVFRSADGNSWDEMDVDYRAVARYALMAGPDREHLWVATDTGMILRLAQR